MKNRPNNGRFFFIIHRMNLPDRIVTETELKYNTGERGTRMWIAYNDMIYDVADCQKWRTGLHEFLHFTGQDLTSEFPDALHKLEVFGRACIQVSES